MLGGMCDPQPPLNNDCEPIQCPDGQHIVCVDKCVRYVDIGERGSTTDPCANNGTCVPGATCVGTPDLPPGEGRCRRMGGGLLAVCKNPDYHMVGPSDDCATAGCTAGCRRAGFCRTCAPGRRRWAGIATTRYSRRGSRRATCAGRGWCVRDQKVRGCARGSVRRMPGVRASSCASRGCAGSAGRWGSRAMSIACAATGRCAVGRGGAACRGTSRVRDERGLLRAGPVRGRDMRGVQEYGEAV